jgi:hypothetical protein
MQFAEIPEAQNLLEHGEKADRLHRILVPFDQQIVDLIERSESVLPFDPENQRDGPSGAVPNDVVLR